MIIFQRQILALSFASQANASRDAFRQVKISIQCQSSKYLITWPANGQQTLSSRALGSLCKSRWRIESHNEVYHLSLSLFRATVVK